MYVRKYLDYKKVVLIKNRIYIKKAIALKFILFVAYHTLNLKNIKDLYKIYKIIKKIIYKNKTKMQIFFTIKEKYYII
jgi:hypothetical protein